MVNSLSAEFSLILCCYVNTSPQVQIIRIADVSDFYLERVIFPGQRLLFEVPFNASLEVHTGRFIGAIAADTIACETLKVKQSEPSE
ncbi:MAG: DUF1830 domain-containing protein [Myxacorys chilensis ATA2-1-KO14]|jgi:hypothetical protein|nr:DUF1830 domain-containing protein [Myxacorys chilensis ATA2-1-KO14]